MGFISISLSWGLFLGTVLGWIVYSQAGYHAVWAMCFGWIGIDAVLRLFMIEPRKSPADVISNEYDNKPQPTTPAFPATKAAETTSMVPLLVLWKHPWFVAMIIATTLDSTLLTSFDGALTIHLHDTFNYDTLGVGLTYISLILPTFLAPVSGKLADHFGGRVVLSTLLMVGIVPLVCMRFVDHDSLGQKVLICALLAAVGVTSAGRLGIYSAQVDHAASAFSVANPVQLDHDKTIAQAQGLWSAAFSIGCGLGPVWGGPIQGTAGWKTETWTVALLSASAAVPASLLADGWVGRRWQKVN